MNPAVIRRHARTLAHATDLLAIACANIATPHLADGYPTRASGSSDDGGRGQAELTPTEGAVHARLGDLHNLTTGIYHPGPVTDLDDLDELVHGAIDLVRRALNITDKHQPRHTVAVSTLTCIGTDLAPCAQIADPLTRDGRCPDCRRSVESEARRRRRYVG